MDVDSSVNDSGYEPVAVDDGKDESRDVPGVLEERPDYRFHGEVMFVTYTQSRMDDPEEFYRCLRESLAPHLPRTGVTGQRGEVMIFGAKELHVDGHPHYHVVLRFSPIVCWNNTREKLRVFIDVDGRREVDTHAINIRKRSRREPMAIFLEHVQAYVAKEGVVFGERIVSETLSGKALREKEDELLRVETRAEAEAILKQHFPRKYIWQHLQCAAFLKTKVSSTAMEHVPTFKVKPWRLTARMAVWKKANFPKPSGGGRPTALVLIGPSKYGKTEWALSFGKPAKMMGGWNMDELTKPGITHIVLNDIDVRRFPHVREMLGCQEFVTATGRYREERTIALGIPVIWTCSEENSPLRFPEWVNYIKQSGAVVVKLRSFLFK
ncbi:Fc.00g023810.m01.CDS01 [Cosmosporella sp. VM-42]